jgi:uncharacterized OB-fold protein
LAETATATQKRPILPFLRIPEDSSVKPYLVGAKCKNCGTVYLGARMGCSRCMSTEPMEEIKLSDHGELHVFSIVHQSAPGIPTPYIAAIVDLPEGVSIRCNIEGVEPDPKNLKFGMPVEMYTETVHVDKEGNEIVAFKFRPSNGAH